LKSVFYIIILVLLLFLFPNRFSHFDEQYNFVVSIIYAIALVYYLLQQRKYTSNWLRFDVIFLVGYTIVHFQIPFLASLGIEPERPDFIWINKQVVNFATWMSAVSIVLWMWGYVLYRNKRKRRKVSDKVKQPIIKISYYKYDIILLLSFIAFLGLVGSSIFQGVYDGGKSWGTGANYAFLILRVLLYLRVVYFFKDFSKGTHFKIIIQKLLSYKIFIGVLGVYTLLFLMSGDRGPVMQVALIIGGAYALYIRPIPFKRLILFIFLGAFVFTIIRFGRGRDANEFDQGNIFQRGYASFAESEGTNVTDELASSVRIQYRALDVVPDQHPYLYGITFFTVGVGVIPFMGSTVIETFDIPQQYTATSSFFTILGQGQYATYGEGSEVLADIYVNFGLYGTFLIMFLFGMFSGKVFYKAKELEFKFVLISLILLTYALTINRGMLFSPLKDIVYILVINHIVIRLNK